MDDELQRRPSHWGETQESPVNVQASEAAYHQWAQDSAGPQKSKSKETNLDSAPSSDSDRTAIEEPSYLGDTLKRRQTLWRRGTQAKGWIAVMAC